MDTIKVYIERGKKRSFACAIEWPGWCRNGRDENSALKALFDSGSRYAQIFQSSPIKFQAPTDPSMFIVTERLDGNATTDFGAPSILLDADTQSVDQLELERYQTLLLTCWQAFDRAIQRATGKELRKGPRGGGRELEKIVRHVIEADRGYLRRLAWKQKREPEKEIHETLHQTRQAVQSALVDAVRGGLPEAGPRGGVIWPPRYFVRRVAWHVLDHTWEIDDRIL